MKQFANINLDAYSHFMVIIGGFCLDIGEDLHTTHICLSVDLHLYPNCQGNTASFVNIKNIRCLCKLLHKHKVKPVHQLKKNPYTRP